MAKLHNPALSPAKKLYAHLQDIGVRCWFAPEDLKIGDNIRLGIDQAIRVHDKLLLILSEESINSYWVEHEVETAFAKERITRERVLFPIRIDDSVMSMTNGWAATIHNTRHIGDFRDWQSEAGYAAGFGRLLADLKA